MKLTISIDKKRFQTELPNEECSVKFGKIVSGLLGLEKTQPGTSCGVRPQENLKPAPAETVQPLPEDSRAAVENIVAAATYKGFLYIKCPNCGEVRGFYARTETGVYHCNRCGMDSDLPLGLVPLQVRCKCGSRFHYRTNMTDDIFDIPCLNCGNPVSVEYNRKADSYETLQ